MVDASYAHGRRSRDARHQAPHHPTERPIWIPTRQVQGVHKDLLSFEEKTERKLREHDGRFNRLDGELDALDRKIDAKVDGLAKALPAIVVDAVRGANRDREGKH